MYFVFTLFIYFGQAKGSYFCDQGLNQGPRQKKCQGLATEPWWNSQDDFSRVQCNVESERNSLYSIILKSKSPSCTLKGSFTQVWFRKILVWCKYSNSDTFLYKVLQKSHSLILLSALAKMSLGIEKLSTTVYKFSKISIFMFYLTAQILSLVKYILEVIGSFNSGKLSNGLSTLKEIS